MVFHNLKKTVSLKTKSEKLFPVRKHFQNKWSMTNKGRNWNVQSIRRELPRDITKSKPELIRLQHFDTRTLLNRTQLSGYCVERVEHTRQDDFLVRRQNRRRKRERHWKIIGAFNIFHEIHRLCAFVGRKSMTTSKRFVCALLY